MKTLPPLLCAALAAAAALLATGCANVVSYGNEASLQIAAEYKAASTEPVHLQVGLRDRTFIAVPPKHSLRVGELADERKIAKGELLSTASVFAVQRVNDKGEHDANGGSVHVRNVFFTGIAAERLAGLKDTPTQNASDAEAKEVADEVGKPARAKPTKNAPAPAAVPMLKEPKRAPSSGG